MRSSLTPKALASALLAFTASIAAAVPVLIATGSLSGTASDLSGLNYKLENGLSANLLGGMGSGLAWAGGNTFLSLPDRGPNATPWNSTLDDTTSYIPRFHTLQLNLVPNAPGAALPFSLTPTLQSTTLLYSTTALNYGAVAPTPTGLVASATLNAAGKYYFSGRSDNFAPGVSTNPTNARLDTEGIRVSADGLTVFVSDEYGPYVYQFDRATGQRLRTYSLPAAFGVSNLSAQGKTEISSNTTGRVANKGMEGLAISPDGKTLFGFMQSPLIQDGGDGGAFNRIVKIDVASGKVSQFAYNNTINGKTYNSSELLALNDHELVVLERDGKGLGDAAAGKAGSTAAVKQLIRIDLANAAEVSGVADLSKDPSKAVTGTSFMDIRAALNAAGIPDSRIPAKLEGIAFGADVVVNGQLMHTLYLANDNDFLSSTIPNGSTNAVAYDNQFYVFAFSDNALVPQSIAASVPEPSSHALLAAGLAALGFAARRRNTRRA